MAKASWMLVMVILTGLVSMLPVNAVALTPVTDEFSIDVTTKIANCQGFSVMRHLVAHFVVEIFFDENGVPVALQVHVNEENTIFNSKTGKSLEYHANINFFFDLTTGDRMDTGAPIVITLQFEGIVFQDTGRLLVDSSGEVTFKAGSFDLGPDVDATAFCPLLA
jgi:hypothetical protein